MKILISWVAFNNDFTSGPDSAPKVQKDGPTWGFHQHFFEGYDRHIILSSEKEDDTRLNLLLNTLQHDFPAHKLEGHYLHIEDVIHLREIRTKVETFLFGLEAEEIHLYISPGTPAMQTAWYLVHLEAGLPTTLLQTRSARFTPDKKPELIRVDVEKSPVPVTAILSERSLSAAVVHQPYRITDSIAPVYNRARKAAETDHVPVLILGETGTGKEHLARYVHDSSVRKSHSFVAVNCSALGDALLESRLFGYVKGAFSGAEKNTKGLFEEADGGTLFLDEIGDISPQMQQSLLRVVQTGELLPVGANQPRKVNVRIIAATHRNLPAMCSAGNFRWDLYYRLAVVELSLPALRERGPEEVKQMLDYFITAEQKNLRKTKALVLSPEARTALLQYPWPGNLRELENLIRRLYVFAEGPVSMSDLPASLTQVNGPGSLRWEDAEKALIAYVLKLKKGNQSQALKALGYRSLNTLKSKLKKYGLV